VLPRSVDEVKELSRMAEAAKDLYKEAERRLQSDEDPARYRQVKRAARLACAWAFADAKGVLDPHLHAGFGHPGDDLARAHLYMQAGQMLLQGQELASPAIAPGIVSELSSLTPLEDGEHASLFLDVPDKAVTVDTNLMVHPSCITAAETLLVSSNPQPLLVIRGEPMIMTPPVLGRNHARLAQEQAPFTYFSAGTDRATVHKLGTALQAIRSPSANMRAKISSIRQQLTRMPRSEPALVTGPVSGYAGLCNAVGKTALMRLTEHEESREKSGANSRWAFHQAVGQCTHFGVVFNSQLFTRIHKLLPNVSPQLIHSTLEALTQAITQAVLNDDLMGRSEWGGTAKRINKAVNRHASKLIAVAGGSDKCVALFPGSRPHASTFHTPCSGCLWRKPKTKRGPSLCLSATSSTTRASWPSAPNWTTRLWAAFSATCAPTLVRPARVLWWWWSLPASCLLPELMLALSCKQRSS